MLIRKTLSMINWIYKNWLITHHIYIYTLHLYYLYYLIFTLFIAIYSLCYLCFLLCLLISIYCYL